MKPFKTFLSASLLICTFQAIAQEAPVVKNPPLIMETFAGDRALAYQMIINKKLQSVPKLGFFSVTNLQAEWGEPKVNDYMLQGNLTYNIVKGIDLSVVLFGIQLMEFVLLLEFSFHTEILNYWL